MENDRVVVPCRECGHGGWVSVPDSSDEPCTRCGGSGGPNGGFVLLEPVGPGRAPGQHTGQLCGACRARLLDFLAGGAVPPMERVKPVLGLTDASGRPLGT